MIEDDLAPTPCATDAGIASKVCDSHIVKTPNIWSNTSDYLHDFFVFFFAVEAGVFYNFMLLKLVQTSVLCYKVTIIKKLSLR